MAELREELDSKFSLMGLRRKDAYAVDKVLEMVDKKTFEQGREGPKMRTDPVPLKPTSFV